MRIGRRMLSVPVRVIGVVLLMVPLLSGCWDSLELDKRAVVLGISVDEADSGAAEEESEVSHLRGKFPAPKNDMIRLTAQIALPGRIPLGPGEGGGVDGKQTVWPIEVTGHTVDDALMNLQQQISSRLFFGHLRIIVVSKMAAQKGLQNLNDYFRRNSEVRRTTWMLISEGKAKDLMTAAPKLGRLPTLYLITTMDQAVKMGKFPNNFLGAFWSDSSKKGQEAYLPYVKLKKDSNVEIKGLAFFRGDKMKGVTKPFEIAAFMSIKGLNPAGYRGFVPVDGRDGAVNLNATYRKSKIEAEIRNGRPHISVSVQLEVDLEEKTNERILIDNPDIIRKIERADQQAAGKMYRAFIDKMKEEGSDIFGFGEYIRAKEPRYWDRNIKTKEKWREIYKDIPVDVSVKIHIRRIGMKTR